MSTPGQPLNFDETDPAPPSGAVNVVFQADAPTPAPTNTVRNISAYLPVMTATVGGAVPTPPNDSTKCLDGTGNWSSKGSGGGGGSNDDISYYLSPTTITPPSGLSWAAHANASESFNDNGAMVLTTFSSSYLEVIGESISSGDFNLVTCFSALPGLTGTNAVGLVLWDSGSGKIVRFFIEFSGGTASINIQHDPSFTSGSPSSVFQYSIYVGWGSALWLRINYSGGNYTFYASVDGQSWDYVYQESATAYLPVEATNAGVGVYQTSAHPSNFVFPHFNVNSYVGS